MAFPLNSRIHVLCRNNLGRFKSRFIQKLEIQRKINSSKYFQEGRNKKCSKYYVGVGRNTKYHSNAKNISTSTGRVISGAFLCLN